MCAPPGSGSLKWKMRKRAIPCASSRQNPRTGTRPPDGAALSGNRPRRLVRGICTAPCGGYRAMDALRLVRDPGEGMSTAETTRGRGAPCRARGRGNTNSRRMHVPSVRDRPTSPAPCTTSAWWTHARSARARARTQRRRRRKQRRSLSRRPGAKYASARAAPGPPARDRELDPYARGLGNCGREATRGRRAHGRRRQAGPGRGVDEGEPRDPSDAHVRVLLSSPTTT